MGSKTGAAQWQIIPAAVSAVIQPCPRVWASWLSGAEDHRAQELPWTATFKNSKPLHINRPSWILMYFPHALVECQWGVACCLSIEIQWCMNFYPTIPSIVIQLNFEIKSEGFWHKALYSRICNGALWLELCFNRHNTTMWFCIIRFQKGYTTGSNLDIFLVAVFKYKILLSK